MRRRGVLLCDDVMIIEIKNQIPDNYNKVSGLFLCLQIGKRMPFFAKNSLFLQGILL